MARYMKLFAAVAAMFVMAAPAVLFAGGTKEKIQKRLNAAPSNMQFTNERNRQYEPYYMQESWGGQQVEQSAAVPVQQYIERHVEVSDMVVGAEGLVKDEESDRREKKQDAKKPSRPVVAAPSRAMVAPYVIYRTNYTAELEDEVVSVKGNALFEVFSAGWTQIPLVRADVGLIDVKINRGSSFVTMQGGKYFLMVDRPGRYSLDVEFLIKAHREREGGPGNFNFEVMPAPISQFELTMPETEVEVFIEPSIKTEIKREQKATVAWAVMPNTSVIQVRWTKAIPKETIAPVKLEPKVYADTTTYAAIGDAVIRCQSQVTYSILQSEVPSFRLALPEDVTVLGVSGNELRDWKVSQDKGTQYVDVYLNFGVRGTYALNLSYERKIGEGSGVAQIPWLRALNVEREKGFYGIAASTNVELAVNKAENVSAIDVRELPQSVWSSSTNPILLAFKYLKQPVGIDIEVTKHEEIPVLVAAVDSAEFMSLLTDEGKSVTKAVYQVRNNVKQFLHLDLPEGASLWSVFVAGKPVKPAKNKEGSILVPLEKSQLSGEDLTRFPVEVVYAAEGKKFAAFGGRALKLPRIDLPSSSLRWSIFLPREFAYLHFGGTVKPSKDASWGRRQGGRADGMVMKQALSRMSDQLVSYEVQSAAPRESYGKGVLPIKIDIPQEGKLLTFTKLLVTDKETPQLTFWYVYGALQASAVVRIFWTLALLAAAWWLLRRFFGLFRRKE